MRCWQVRTLPDKQPLRVPGWSSFFLCRYRKCQGGNLMSKPRIAIFDFACCEGCQLQIVNLEEEILSLISLVSPVEWREAMSDQSQEYDIAIIEGSITRKEDEERIREIRSRAKILIALGACATIGGVNKLKNYGNLDEKKRDVYGDSASMPHLDTMPTKAVSEVVTVDLMIHGCPIDKK
ncbi:MAG: hypothetical protein EHM28_14125, partial [Spirochaetaceae bacterium]